MRSRSRFDPATIDAPKMSAFSHAVCLSLPREGARQ